MSKVLVTGAAGFIGRRLVSELLTSGFDVIASMRKHSKSIDQGVVQRIDGEITPQNNWTQTLKGVSNIVHLAARAHVLKDSSSDPLAEFRKTNVHGTLNLAAQAAKNGVKRFIFISSIGVNGNQSARPFTINDPPNPVEPYAVSKFEAESGLRQIADETGMELVIIRPPLVYGPGAPGNFGRLVRLVQKGMFIPLGKVNNRRSLVALDNLVDLILTCLEHPAAAGQIFLVSDGEDLSTPELIRKIARTMGKKARLLPVPPYLLRLAGRIMGKSAEVERLIGSLQVDITHTCETLGWKPVVSMDEQLKKIVEAAGIGRVE